jgi:MoCo/4Fe-4S cofactor protein with predicted Tat translocation signal
MTPHSLTHLQERIPAVADTRLWKSLDQLANTPEFREAIEREFPIAAAEWPDALSRRRFLTLMGASLAAAGLASCSRQPIERLVPYVKQPEDLIPGTPLHFASSDVLGGFARGVLVESHEGRPTKIEGNPDHPASLGGTDVFMQASILELYDPDRSQSVLHRGFANTWDAFLAALLEEAKKWAGDGGLRLAFVTGGVTSPSLRHQFRRISDRFPNARWVVHEPACNLENRRVLPSLEHADVILSLDADFLAWGPAMLTNARAFTRRREPGNAMNRLYVVESLPSLTGAMADHRFAMSPSEISRLPEQISAEIRGVPDSAAAPWLQPLVRDLRNHPGRSLVLAGEFLPDSVQQGARLLNEELSNVGNTVAYPTEALIRPGSHTLAELTSEMLSGSIDAVFLLDCNPVYSAPADVPFAEALRKASFSVHHGLYADESAAVCRWHLPALHPLESWGDALAFDGTAGIIQPLIQPLYGGISPHVLAAALLNEWPANDYDIVRSYWRGILAADDFESLWRRAVHDGLMARMVSTAEASPPGTQPIPPAPNPSATSGLELSTHGADIAPLQKNPNPNAGSGLELLIRPDPHVYDGRFANNAWLQELPKPMTKIVWENAAHMAPATAERLGLHHSEEIALIYRGRSIRAPLWVLPGMAENCVQVTLGYGRTRAGKVGNGLGFNSYQLRTMDARWGGPGLEVRTTGRMHRFATTQDHNTMAGRDLVRFADLATYQETPHFAQEAGHTPAPDETLYPPFAYEGNAWGMAIDLNACIGCSVCTIACQAENNIPVVGREQVQRGREMHWIRVDRYFKGTIERPDILHQPVPCMHCENAPCEPVCPVAATLHDHEGLNAMVYNRCIGTRYCSNNCPYKVRRFNFLSYVDASTPTLKLQRNPNVTLRSRGVMEKCTYCLQRINFARMNARNENRPIRDGEIVPACAQACPAEAIVFGNINDPESRVSKLKADPRNYGLLAELNTRPRTTYLAKIFNPNPELKTA